mmetsp:Transcript_40352/g.92797  ORF Transcript_40352/g.92797 Transcript_40352/m.92797 type:complete len:202 (-) Transcript_40352:344-949(-)
MHCRVSTASIPSVSLGVEIQDQPQVLQTRLACGKHSCRSALHVCSLSIRLQGEQGLHHHNRCGSVQGDMQRGHTKTVLSLQVGPIVHSLPQERNRRVCILLAKFNGIHDQRSAFIKRCTSSSVCLRIHSRIQECKDGIEVMMAHSPLKLFIALPCDDALCGGVFRQPDRRRCSLCVAHSSSVLDKQPHQWLAAMLRRTTEQ